MRVRGSHGSACPDPFQGAEGRGRLPDCGCQGISTTCPCTEAELDELRRRQVAEARRSGATWDEIGNALGMSRQAAWEYFAKRASDHLEEMARANSDLTEDQAMELAVEEVRAVRRERRGGR